MQRSWRGAEGKEPQAKQGLKAESEEHENPFGLVDSPFQTPNVSEFYRAQPVYDRRIHVLGVGNVGLFVAHSLRSLPNPPPVTLIFHHWESLNKWEQSGQKVQLVTDGNTESREGIEADLARPRRRFHGKELGGQEGFEDSAKEPGIPEDESKEPISSLVVCTKTPHVLQALSAVRHRLKKDSVILFLQNGMGIVEEVNKEIFPDPEIRPHYMMGLSSHGVLGHQDNPFTAVHAGAGTISLGILPPERNREALPYAQGPRFRPGLEAPVEPKSATNPTAESADSTVTTFKWTSYDRYLLRTFLRSPVLCATAFSPPDLLQMQLEKLAVNCIINPLTVMLDARNGSVLYNYAITRTMRLLLAEISLVIRSLPELQYIPNVAQRFDPGRLETIVVSTAHRTRDNISSMLTDVRKGLITDIDYMNGWIVKKGEEQGARCLMNYMMVNLVKGKANMIQMEIGEDVPFWDSKPGESGLEIKDEGGKGNVREESNSI